MEVGQSNEPDALKFVCDLSTLLVATIQEAKDRISQVEYIFCCQLYPTFQKNSKSLQKVYVEARKAAEQEYKEMHRKMIDQTEELYLSKEKVLADKANLMMRKISDLEEKLSFKDVEIENLQQEIESKSSEVDCKQKLLRQCEDRVSSLFTNTRELEEEKCQLKEELGTKNEDLNKRKDIILRMDESLKRNASERKDLELKLENMEACLNDLRIKFGTKAIELDECRKLQEQLVQQNDVNISELTKKEQLLSAHEKEKALLLSRLKDLENKTEELQVKDRDSAIPEKSEYYKQLVQKIESKHSELLTEKQKRRDLLNAYKSLKSQYNFLCARSGLTAENTLPKPKLEVENEPHSHDAFKNSTSVSNMVVGETTKAKESSSSSGNSVEKNATSNQTPEEVVGTTKVKKEMKSGSDSDEERDTRSNQAFISGSPFTSKPPSASKWKTSRNSSSSAGGKRITSDWRGTRSRQTPKGPDPHDDFLDTPLENIRANLAQAVREEEEEVHKIPAPVSLDMECDNSDDETELDINAEAGLEKQQQPQALKRSPKAFKYIEPVRKKAQREALKGIECKQCKKFYDAVLPDGEDENTGEGKKGFRCEHLDGVSRHRYRFAPPMTPEGFWNIGFDSEI